MSIKKLAENLNENETLTTSEVAKKLGIKTSEALTLLTKASEDEELVYKFGYRTKKDGLQPVDYFGDSPPKSNCLVWQFNCPD